MYLAEAWIDGFDMILFGVGGLCALAAYRPDIARAFMRNGPPEELIEQRLLGMRTLFVGMTGTCVGGGIVAATAPNTALRLLVLGCAAGTVASMIIWTALVLSPRARALPLGDQAGKLGDLLRRLGRNPWVGLWKGLVGGAVVAVAIGALVLAWHRIHGYGSIADLYPYIVVGGPSGTVMWLCVWANTLGEYVRTGTLPDPRDGLA